MSRRCLSAVDVAILAGGLGTRLKAAIGETPKILAPIRGRPFVDYLLNALAGYGARRVVFGLGYLAGAVEEHLAVATPSGLVVEAAVEPQPLGTAGALRFLRPRLGTDPVLVLNGDSWLDGDWCAFLDFHRAVGARLSMMCAEVEDTARYGAVELEVDRTIRLFREKSDAGGRGLISAGFYLFAPPALDALARSAGPSLERDFFQTRPPGTIHGFVAKGARFMDIGTPESLAGAAAFLPPLPERRP